MSDPNSPENSVQKSPDEPNQIGATAASSSPYSALFWITALILVGVLVYYVWHTGELKKDISNKAGEITKSTQLLSQSDERIGVLTESEKNLRATIETNNSDHQNEVNTLTDQLDSAKQAKADLQADMAKQRDEHKNTLEAQQQEAAINYSKLKGLYDTANQDIAELRSNEEQLRKDLADTVRQHEIQAAEAATAHQAFMQQLEQSLNERIAMYQTTLEGSEPERAALFNNLDQQAQTSRQELASTREALNTLEAAKAELDQRLANAEETIDQQQRALDLSDRNLADVQRQLTDSRKALMDLQTDLNAAKAQSAADLAAAENRLQAAKEAHAAAAVEAATLLENTKANAAQAAAEAAALLENTKSNATQAAVAAAALLQKTKADAADSLAMTKEQAAADMKRTRDEHTVQITAAESRIAKLDEELEGEKAALAALQQEHDTMVADLNSRLSNTERSLAELDALYKEAMSSAAAKKRELEQQIAQKETQIGDLEETIASEREQARKEQLALQQQNTESLAGLRGMYKDISGLGGQQTELGMLLSLANSELRFTIGGHKLPSGNLPNLDRIAEFLVKYPNLLARIEGHSDNTGREETNLELSSQRANSVLEALVERGVAAERLVAEGIGDSRPISSNETPAGRRKNRRVEVYVIESQDAL